MKKCLRSQKRKTLSLDQITYKVKNMKENSWGQWCDSDCDGQNNVGKMTTEHEMIQRQRCLKLLFLNPVMMIDMSNIMSAQHKHNHTNNAINNFWQTKSSKAEYGLCRSFWSRRLYRPMQLLKKNKSEKYDCRFVSLWWTNASDDWHNVCLT